MMFSGKTVENKVDIAISILDYIFIISAVILTGSIWTRTGLIFEYLGFFKMGALLPLCLSFGLKVKQNKYISKCVTWTLLYVVAAIISLVICLNITSNFVLFAPMILSILFFCSMESRQEFLQFYKKFVNVMFILSVVSLFFFLLGSTLNIVPPTGVVQYSWDWQRECPTYFHLYFEPQKINLLGYTGARNCGIFSEAPMYAYLLVTAILCEMIIENKRPVILAVLCMTTITTFSTTAIVSLVIICVWSAAAHNYRSNFINLLKKYLVVGCILLGFVFVMILLVDKSTTGSFGVRLDHLTGCFKSFVRSFPFGCGVGGAEKAIYPFLKYKQGLSVGLPYFLAQTGIVGLMAYVLPSVASFFLYLRNKEFSSALFVAVYTWTYFMTNLDSNSMLTWVFINAVMVCGAYRNLFAASRVKKPSDNILDLVIGKSRS